jgi:DNA-binding IclR family transcriptional regulator
MNMKPLRTPAWKLCLASAALACMPAMADTAAEMSARHKAELAACNNGQTQQTRAACLDEARSAYAEAVRGELGDGMPADRSNTSKRCDALSGDNRSACEARMQGQGTTSGSVEAGGIYRELVTTEPAPTAKPKHHKMMRQADKPSAP